MEDLLGLGKLSNNGLEVIKTIYPDLAQPGVKKAGYALETVFDFANTILLPLKLVNENSKVYFQKHMDLYKKKMNEIPEEKIGTVPPEIGLPILDELLKVTNDDLAELFVNLLVNTSNIDHSQDAHPSFINIIKSIVPDEARIIKFLITNPMDLIFIRIVKLDRAGTVPIYDNDTTNLNEKVILSNKDNEAFYLNNLQSLGLLKSELMYFIQNVTFYEKLEKEKLEEKEKLQKEVDKIGEPYNDGKPQIEIDRGRYILTEYGKGFIKSISLG